MLCRLTLLGFLFVFSGSLPLTAAPPAGLKFQGSEHPIDKRTSYDVFGKNSPEFSGAFTVEFNLSLYPTTEIGYILRVKSKEDNTIYNLFYDGQGDQLTFRLNEEGKSNLIVASLDKELLNAHWFNMKIAFDLEHDSIKLSINKQSFGARIEGIPNVYHPIILFGRSDHIIDVPTFAIKDLSVGNQTRYSFPLNESKGNVVHDTNGDVFGSVTNPEWLVNDAYHWRHKASFHSRSVAGANYDPESKEIYYFNKDSLLIYNVISGHTDIRVFEESCPVKLTLGMNFIDTIDNKLYSFEAYKENYTGPTVASLDLDTYQWSAESNDQLPSPLHHHASYFDPSTDRFTLFGGFGRMRYSKEFYSYDINKKAWDTLQGFTGDILSPRYFCSMGYLKKSNAIYIFGGMGNESGEQIVGRQYYYDLYKIDLDTKHISKLWQIEWKQNNMVPVRGMVILNDSSFYTLCYPEHVSESHLQLFRFSLKDGSYDILGDSIPIRSDKITTNANLYYDGTLDNLYAVVQEFDDDISSNVHVYALSFPPISAADLARYSGEKKKPGLAIIIAISSLTVFAVVYLVYRRSRGRNIQEQDSVAIPKTSVLTDDQTRRKATRANAIYLFGEFTVRDRKNRDITYMFSAQLKQIFCLILQYTTTEGGITSQRLSNILWPDKPADKVKNSRGVTINHLRKALSELDGIELIHDKGNFKIEQSGEFYCDYTHCMEIIAAHETEQRRDELIEILSRGKFLQLSDHPLFDTFKEETEKKLEPALQLELEKSFTAGQYQTTITLAEGIFNIDPLNEFALSYQIKAMDKLKMEDEARLRYKAFALEYKKALGIEYPQGYKDLL